MHPSAGEKSIWSIDVGWGEGTLDEMCLNYVWIRYPRDEYLSAVGK